MVELNFRTAYKSITSLAAPSLPSFALLTGVNGSGKTHLLEAVSRGDVVAAVGGRQLETAEIQLLRGASIGIPLERPLSQFDWTNQVVHKGRERLRSRRDRTASDLRKVAVRHGGNLIPESTTDSMLIKMAADDIAELAFSETPPAVQAAKVRERIDKIRRDANEQLADAGDDLGDPSIIRAAARVLDCDPVELEPDILTGRHLLVGTKSIFEHGLAQSFSVYRDLVESNRYRQFRSQMGYPTPEAPLPEAEYLDLLGPAPWTAMNAMLEELGYYIRVTEPDDDPKIPYEPRIINERQNVTVSPNELSSGEMVFLGFLLAAFNLTHFNGEVFRTQLLLLDEPDATLHPSLVKDLLRLIEDVIVSQFGIAVVMTTHSPTTVALAQDLSCFRLDQGTIHAVSSTRAVQSLLHGVPHLSVGREPRLQVFVESENDANRFEKVLSAAKADDLITLTNDLRFTSFGSHRGDGGCSRVQKLVPELRGEGLQSIVGIIDHDGKNTPSDGIVILGGGKRYSCDNYFIDPLLLAALCACRNWHGPQNPDRKALGLPETGFAGELERGDQETLQRASDAIVNHVHARLPKGKRDCTPVTCPTISGIDISMPAWWLEMNGKNLFAVVKKAIPALQGHDSEIQLIEDLLISVVVRAVGLVSIDLLDTFLALPNLAKPEQQISD